MPEALGRGALEAGGLFLQVRRPCLRQRPPHPPRVRGRAPTLRHCAQVECCTLCLSLSDDDLAYLAAVRRPPLGPLAPA